MFSDAMLGWFYVFITLRGWQAVAVIAFRQAQPWTVERAH
jgi:hypothetical protein